MNNHSVSHTYVQNQQPSSWIDDMFRFGTYAEKGRKRMSHERALADYAEELVGRFGKYDGHQYELHLDMLPEEEKNELAHYYIESINREIEWACYGDDESINSEFLCAMLQMLRDDNAVTRARFAEVTRNNILTYYRQSLNDVLSTACDSYLHMQMHEAGYRAGYDNEHGDIVWSRF